MKQIAIYIWQPPTGGHNFGELLGLNIVRKMGFSTRLVSEMSEDELKSVEEVLVPIGTAFSRYVSGKIPESAIRYFWGCGGGADPAFNLRHFPNIRVCGVRGPITLGLLQLPIETPRADTGLFVSKYWSFPEAGKGGTVYFAHINNVSKVSEEFLNEIVADELWSPRCADESEFEPKLEKVAEAGFAATSSLHVGVIRVALNLPWAFIWPPGCHPEYPTKYSDFCQSVGIDFRACQTIDEGRKWWAAEGRHAKIDPAQLDALLAAFPFKP